MSGDDIKVGDEIYVDTHLYISHGRDDVVGGKATITKIENGRSAGKPCRFVTTKEHPGHSYNWDQHLKHEQDNLRAEFGEQRAYEDPDERPDMNTGAL